MRADPREYLNPDKPRSRGRADAASEDVFREDRPSSRAQPHASRAQPHVHLFGFAVSSVAGPNRMSTFSFYRSRTQQGGGRTSVNEEHKGGTDTASEDVLREGRPSRDT